jgi:hypothetical protein
MGTNQSERVARGWLCLATVVVLLGACGRAADGGALAPAATPSAKTSDVGGCPITRPPDPPFAPPAPPAPTSPSTRGGQFWYGTPALWTSLQRNGNWSALPYHDGAYTQKVFWWSQGYDWRSPLTVTGRRTDGPAAPLRASTATNASADDIGASILVGVEFPEAGCWEITGHLRAATLTFVVWVA